MRVPIVTRRRERLEKRIEGEVLDRAIKSIASTVDQASLVEKGFLTGNAAQMPAQMPGSSWSNQTGVTSSALISRVTQNLAASFGRAPEDVEVGLAEQGLSWGAPFPPGRPLDPYYGYRKPARTFNYAVGENVQVTPRWNRVSFPTIKAIYDAYDVAQICVRHLINDVRSLDYNWEPIPGIKADVSEDIEQAIAFFDSPDKRQPFRSWLAEYLQDVLRYDAGALYIRRNEAGDPIAWEVVDGSTIIPLVDFYGRRPEDENDTNATPEDLFGGDTVPAYTQIINGLPWDWLTADDLIYQPWNPLPESQYGLAPLEAVLLSANTDIRFQWHFLQFFTEGTLPAGFMEAPPDQSDPAQIAHWQEVWDAVMEGDQSKKQQIRWVPSGSKFSEAKPDASKFDSEFPLYLMRRTCAAFGVTPNDLGFTENVNKSSGDTQIDVQFRVGTSPLLRHVEDVINLFCRQHLKLRCRIHFDDGRETEDRVATATAMGVYLDHGVISIDEVRQELGKAVDPSKPSPRYINNARSGPIPLLALESVAGKVDPETFGLADGQEPLDTAFVPPPGTIAPQGSPEAIAAAESTGQMARDLRNATTGKKTPEPPEPGAVKALPWETLLALIDKIEKDTAGITVATGIQGNELADSEDDEDEEDQAVKAELVALALRRWRENSRNRLRKGRQPREFVDPNLPPDVHAAVWARLSKAGSREEVDAAFADLGKPSAGDRPAFHSQADRIVQHYTPELQAALAAALPGVDEALKAAYGRVRKAATEDATAAEIAAATATAVEILHRTAKASAVQNVLTGLHGDAILQGTHDAAQASGGDLIASVKGVVAPDGYWDRWTPGYGQAAAQAADGGLRDMLNTAGQTISGLNDTTIDRIGTQIAEGLRKGDSYETTAKAVRAVVEDPTRAEAIANTEYCRASTAATVETYAQNNVAQVTWLAEADACPECEANADGSPYPLQDAPRPPQHPNCRCALAPVSEIDTTPEGG